MRDNCAPSVRHHRPLRTPGRAYSVRSQRFRGLGGLPWSATTGEAGGPQPGSGPSASWRARSLVALATTTAPAAAAEPTDGPLLYSGFMSGTLETLTGTATPVGFRVDPVTAFSPDGESIASAAVRYRRHLRHQQDRDHRPSRRRHVGQACRHRGRRRADRVVRRRGPNRSPHWLHRLRDLAHRRRRVRAGQGAGNLLDLPGRG